MNLGLKATNYRLYTHYTVSGKQDATLSQGVPRDAAVNFGRP